MVEKLPSRENNGNSRQNHFLCSSAFITRYINLPINKLIYFPLILKMTNLHSEYNHLIVVYPYSGINIRPKFGHQKINHAFFDILLIF